MLKQQDTRDRLGTHGLVPVGGTSEDLANYIKSEIAKFTAIAKTAGIKL